MVIGNPFAKDGWDSHHNGRFSLLHLRGLEQFDTEPARQLFTIVYTQVVRIAKDPDQPLSYNYFLARVLPITKQTSSRQSPLLDRMPGPQPSKTLQPPHRHICQTNRILRKSRRLLDRRPPLEPRK